MEIEKITKTKAFEFIAAAKKKHPAIKGMMCEIKERGAFEGFPVNTPNLNDTDMIDSVLCTPEEVQYRLNAIFKGTEPNVIDLAFYRKDGYDRWNECWDYELSNHLWIEYAKEKFEKFLRGEDFEIEHP